MGQLICSRCKATTEADSIDEGRSRLDHAIGLYKGKPCEDGKAELFFTGNPKEQTQKKDSKPSSLAKKMIDKTKQQTKDLFNKSKKE